MNNFGKQLQNYAQGNSDKCPHPIKSVDDNNFCHACNVQIKVKVTETDKLRARITALEAERDNLANLLKQGAELVNEYAAENARLTADAKLNDMAWTDNQAALNKQAAEIAQLAEKVRYAYVQIEALERVK